ncbi:MAG: tripartite tricarboxylate transporter substrate binding protein [Reyranella sp.]|uniref:Bug family tripartite tricarboxylate transporter substrate binding protein n=1 Tax=Reyranella sp. TaxID=1929291 RepID=UPI0012206FE8|nr:tripartite tricarboxylate transporter substrate binding protein [Reyranella sp.]TAJ96277.1 MAG: tripartite tricarboxylate transporter substrate binding protein [Reyranella sp.]TBR29284.1 MAG: tripartite tricarboxylate transporter substrate binding protein [Reyranella sp.]
MKISRRRTLGATAALAWVPGLARAQAYPSKPVRLIVPYSAGGGADTTARLIAPKLQEALGQTIVVENKPGAGGMIGDEIVAKAAPDGHTLLIGAFAHAVNPALFPKMPFRTPGDFAPVSLLVTVPELMVITPSHPAKTVAELVALAKAQPGKLSYASSGNGSAQHLAAELFKMRTGTDIQHVPYKGGALAVADVAAGHVPFYFGNMSAALPQARGGRVRPLAVTSAARSPAAPEVPTLAEAGVPDCEISEWNALIAPAGTPPAVIARLHAEIAKIMRMEEIKAKFADLGADAIGSTPDELAAFLRAEMTKWAEVVKAANIKVE